MKINHSIGIEKKELRGIDSIPVVGMRINSAMGKTVVPDSDIGRLRKQITDQILSISIAQVNLMMAYSGRVKHDDYNNEMKRLDNLCNNLNVLLDKTKEIE